MITSKYIVTRSLTVDQVLILLLLLETVLFVQFFLVQGVCDTCTIPNNHQFLQI